MKKSNVKKLVLAGGALLAISFLAVLLFADNSKSTKVGAICYHKFYTQVEVESGQELDIYTIWVDEFENHLQYLQEQNTRVITAKELLDFINGNADLPEKCILLTVDDCDITFYRYAYPLLAEYNMPVNAAIIGNRSDWAQQGTTYADRYCTWDHLQEM